MVRRNLDDARDAIALSFKLIWSDHFWNISSQFDDSKKSVSWYSFTSAFNTLYNSYVTDEDDGYTYQKRSVFGKPINQDKAYNKRINEYLYDTANEELPHEKLKRKYHFFVPVFVWQYNSLKKYLVTVEERLYALYVAVNEDAKYLKSLDPNSNEPALQTLPDRPLSASERFEHGTALEFRQGKVWQQFVSDSQKQTRNKKRPSLDNTDDVHESTRLAGPSSSVANTSSTSEGMSFLSRTSRRIC